MTKKTKSTILQITVSSILVLGTTLVMVAPQVPFIRKISEYSAHITIGMLALSMLFLIIRKPKMMFAGLACTAALCLFLKQASNNVLKLPKANDEAKLKVAHINLGNITFDVKSSDDLLIDREVDVISIQELTPDWSVYLDELLSDDFPYALKQVRIDPYGMAVYSRIPFKKSDTFMCHSIPNINVLIEKNKKNFRLITSYLTPAFNKTGIDKAASQLKTIAAKIDEYDEPIIALGEYNMVYWANEIRSFRNDANLQNSRRDLVNGNLRVPYDHIFFSKKLECTHFLEVRDSEQHYIGITGTYQVKDIQEPQKIPVKLSSLTEY